MDIENENPKRGAGTILRINLKEIYMIIGGALALFMVLAFSLFYFMGRSTEVSRAEQTKEVVKQLEYIQKEQTHQKHLLVSRITYGEERQRVVLFIRDTIFKYWEENKAYLVREKGIPKSKLTIEKAFRIAERNVIVSEIYPDVDALLLAALQFQESRFGLYRKSEAGAIGLNHFMPGTGVLIANAMDIPFSLKMLDDDKASTEMCAKYLNMMYNLYGTWGEALADYNGGPRQAHYYRVGSDKLSGQTAAYIPEILERWEGYRDALSIYKPNIKSVNKEEKKDKK